MKRTNVVGVLFICLILICVSCSNSNKDDIKDTAMNDLEYQEEKADDNDITLSEEENIDNANTTQTNNEVEREDTVTPQNKVPTNTNPSKVEKDDKVNKVDKVDKVVKEDKVEPPTEVKNPVENKDSVVKPVVHEHTWKEVYRGVDIGAWKLDLVKEAWDEEVPVYERKAVRLCHGCGMDLTPILNTDEGRDHGYNHMINGENAGWYKDYIKVQVGTKIVHHEAEYEKVWVPNVIQELDYYECSCGATKEK